MLKFPRGAKAMGKPGTPVTIKRYARQRLYNTDAAAYVTLEDLALMVEQEENFVVSEAETGEDIMPTVLKQIILERAAHG
jgi:polyhydroxyalkanoate synthesis repressor PhaR